MSQFTEPGKHNRLWKEWRAVGRGRHQNFFLEHSEAVIEALGTAMPPKQILLSRARFEQDRATWEEMARQHTAEWYVLEEDKLDALISVPSCGGVCGVFAPQTVVDFESLRAPFLLIGWEIQDPGNVGTLIRSCAALTGGAVLLVGGCNPWSAKVARASAGALLRAPVLTVPVSEAWLALQKLSDYKIFSTVPRGGQSLAQAEWSGRDAVVVGNETRGVPIKIQEFANSVTIDMHGGAESLNVAVAGSIACYQWSRRAKEHG